MRLPRFSCPSIVPRFMPAQSFVLFFLFLIILRGHVGSRSLREYLGTVSSAVRRKVDIEDALCDKYAPDFEMRSSVAHR